jgi:hypothetical protein
VHAKAIDVALHGFNAGTASKSDGMLSEQGKVGHQGVLYEGIRNAGFDGLFHDV